MSVTRFFQQSLAITFFSFLLHSQPLNAFIIIPDPEETIKITPYNELLCTEDHLMRIADIVNTLADHSGAAEIALLAHYPRLNGHQKSLKSCHPLKFIEAFLFEPTLRRRIPEILQGYFTKHGFFGDAQTSGLAQRLNHYHQLGKVNCYREDFAKSLSVDPEVIRPYFDSQDWQGMVIYLVEEMEK